ETKALQQHQEGLRQNSRRLREYCLKLADYAEAVEQRLPLHEHATAELGDKLKELQMALTTE
ncbi:MAG TPA: hypothetical protein VK432_05165, partial [Stellaceae bacterium]|nr:hypothetical protein [Stellaceae bacterium]